MRSLTKLFFATALSILPLFGLFAQCTSFIKLVNNFNAQHIVGIKSDGTLWAWGDNGFGQLGDGTNIDKSSPVQIGTANNWVDVAIGSYHTLAISSDGRLWSWGFNSWYSLGDGTNTSRNTPAQVGTATNWQKVAAGDVVSFAITNTGKLFGWGYNGNGELGDGTITTRTTPVALSPSLNWLRVSSGKYHSMGITDDNKLWSWGANTYGQLGDGTILGKNTPVAVSPLIDWAEIDCGYDVSAGITLDGRLFAWGTNAAGQLGNGTSGAGLYSNTPAQIGTATNWTKLTIGWDHSAALNSSGSGWSWGRNSSGQLGNGGTINSFTPVAFGAAYTFTSVDAGTFYNVAVTTDQQGLSWGSPISYGAPVSIIGRDDIPFTITNPQIFTGLAPSGSSSARLQTTRTHYSSGCAQLIASVDQINHADRIDGPTTANVWIESTQPLQFVKRHFQITPATNATVAVGRVTLYVSQTDFDDFNNQIPAPTYRLPNAPGDATGKSNLRIEKRGGISSNGTGLPETYSGSISTIDPADVDIQWNATDLRWEISFDVTTGFSGFFIKTFETIVLPYQLRSWSGSLNSRDQAELQWIAEEKTTALFNIEKSENSESFETVGSIKRNGNGKYLFTDILPIKASAYYRLRLINNDGSSTLSSVIRLNRSVVSKTILYPIPAKNEVTIEVSQGLLNTEATILSLQGKKLIQCRLNAIKTTLNLSGLTPGIYFILTADGNTNKLVVD
jgi:hypothetical protein